MRWIVLAATVALLPLATPARAASHSAGHASKRSPEPAPDYSAFYVGGLAFTMPPKWVAETAGSPARAGQWRILPPKGQTWEAGTLVALFFGPGKGGNIKDTLDGWIRTMFNADGRPAAAEQKNRQAASGKISEVVVFGTYNQPVPLPGVPPVAKSDFGLIGTVVENAKGNIYWCFTGPEPLVTANLPLFNRMIDSVKPAAK